jgi:hypothetical protein
LVADHFVGEATIMQLGGYKKSAAVLKNSDLPPKSVQVIL